MDIFCHSVNFMNCPQAAREKLVLDYERQEKFLRRCRDLESISDALILNTCNRLEFYFYAKKRFDTSACVGEFMSDSCWDKYKKPFYGPDTIGHLFSVVAGLESQIIGENEIFSQLKSAYSFAIRCESVNTVFHHLLHSAFRVAKDVRTNTNINTGALSIAQAAVELAGTNAAIENSKIFVIGSGSNASLIIKHLIRKNASDFTVFARNPSAAALLIEKTVGLFLPLDELANRISQADIIFTATAAPQPLINPSMLLNIVKPLILIDLSVLPNVDKQVKEMPNIKLFSIDSLNEIINTNNQKRRAQIPKAQAIIDEHLRAFSNWQKGLISAMHSSQKVGR